MSMEVSLPADITADRPVGVIGGGRMGAAIAQIFAGAGFTVHLVEPAASVRAGLAATLATITERRGQAADIVERIIVHEMIDRALADAAIVIEAVSEKLALKQEIFARLDALCPDAILATNTSVIPVGAIGRDVVRKDRVLGAHFWNPPYAVRLVEVVQAEATSAAAVASCMALMTAIGQLPVHVRRDVPGFIGNRLQHALKREAIALVENGICDAETVDFVVRHSFGARLGIMGPLEQSDMVGLDLTLAIHEVVLPDLDRSAGPQALLRERVAAGKTGASVGEGFRVWSPQATAELRDRLDRALLKRE